MPSVEFTKDNALKCMCSKCPVQEKSACVAGKNAAMMKAMEEGMEGMPAASDVAGLYCSTGSATCGDLDVTQNCICSRCSVFSENGLTQWKYCERGNAEAIG